MKKAAGIISIISGVLLLLVPRFIPFLSVCEYHGYPAMHCSDTALAEMVIGVFLIASGTVILLLRNNAAVLLALAVVFLLAIAAYVAPDVYGYCRSSKMPCNYGTIPAVRLIALVAGMTTLVFFVTYMRKIFRKGP